ncbi:hypothetical protein O3G_MSEX012890 [Manduca sexta]|uniref:Peptidoglycan recognition protein family domain-containing protein n=1 Tax=Manduca sexta TaxID=7130 RepID=A0A922CYG0_MANSE|nr:hypothetical protein O3G_MSEX012890 [Manduca sexta]
MWSESDGERENEIMSTSTSNSEVVRMDERGIACVPGPGQQPTSLQFIKSKGIHVGDQFVSVTQTVHNNEVVKGRLLGLELVSAKSTRQLRCSIAVFVCWVLVVASGLAFFIFHYVLAKKLPLDLDIHEPWYLRRGDWQAMLPYSREFLNLPVKNVLIGHSATEYCDEKYACIRLMLAIQNDHLRRGWDDIGPNFLVSGNGIVFEGRGADVFPVMMVDWNRRSIMIMFLGDYRYDASSIAQFEHVSVLLEELVKKQVLTPDYTVWASCQLSPHTVSPGIKVLERMKLFEHWKQTNVSLCLKS